MKSISVSGTVKSVLAVVAVSLLLTGFSHAANPTVEYYIAPGPTVPSVVELSCSGKCDVNLYVVDGNTFNHAAVLRVNSSGGKDAAFFAKPVPRLFFFVKTFDSTFNFKFVPHTEFPEVK